MSHNDSHERDLEIFKTKYETLLEQGRISKKSKAPVFMFLMHKLGLTDIEIEECYTDGGNDLGIDAIHIETRAEDPKIHLIQSKCYESDRKSRNPFPQKSFSRISEFLDVLRTESVDLKKVANLQLQEKIHTIRHLQKTEFPEIIVWLISNGSSAVEHEVHAVRSRLLNDVEIYEFHLSDFIDMMQTRRNAVDKRIFYARDRGLLDVTMGDIRCLNGLISATQLCDLIRHRSDLTKIDPSVFDMNVRGFLGYSSEINRGIFRSATSKRRDRFWIFNNGITMVAEDGKISKGVDQPRIQVRNVSIVNGAQTCSSIFKAVQEYKEKPNFFDDVSIPFRLLFTKSEELIHAIAVTTNSQNRVNPRDLKANDPLQKEIEFGLKKMGIGYIRRRGDELSNSGLERLDALKAGQIILSYQMGRPDKAKAESDSIFTNAYNSVFSKFNAETMIRGNRLYNIISSQKDQVSNTILDAEAELTLGILRYGSFHILSLCAVLEPLFPKMDDEALIQAAIEIVKKDISSRDRTAFYVYFRSPKTTKRLLEIPVQPELPLETPNP